MPTYHQNSPIGKFLAYLSGTICRCNHDKVPGRAFCFECFTALPSKLRSRLFSNGDEDRMYAFEDADQYLNEKGL